MLGAIYVGLSGMNAYARGLQTISNNVANLNSPGFKSTRVNFTEAFSFGGGGLTYQNNVLPPQPGRGVVFGPSRIDFTQGDLRQTSNDLDLAIQGTGFFVLQDAGKTLYARTGSFAVADDGFIALQGATGRLTVLDSGGQPVAVNVNGKRTSTPIATTRITFADNLSSTATADTVSAIKVFDSNGGQHTWSAAFTLVGSTSPGEWTVTVTDETGATVGTSTLKFIGSSVDPVTAHLTISASPVGADPLSVDLDFSQGVTSFSSGTVSSLRASSVDGQGAGDLTSVTVNADGQLTITYSNGKTQQLGAVALADFRDPQQLQRAGDGLFERKGNGEVRLLGSGIEGIGKIVPKQLEASNTNLSDEFGELILIQRGFQASSQVVSVTNDMIQQLFGIRGQA